MSALRLRLMTLNIAHGRGLNPLPGLQRRRLVKRNLLQIARLLHEVQPDIVALQEIDQHSRWAGNFDHLDFLRRHSHLEHSVFGITNRREGLLNLRYGNAILSRFPIVDSSTVVFGNRRVGEKGFMLAEIEIEGRRLPLVNLHFHYRSRSQRFRQLDQLKEWVGQRRRSVGARWAMPPIFCGDFNTQRKHTDVAAALIDHVEKREDYHVFPDAEPTFPSAWPSRTIDFIFLPRVCRRAHGVVVHKLVSDHLPVLVEFVWGSERGYRSAD